MKDIVKQFKESISKLTTEEFKITSIGNGKVIVELIKQQNTI